MLEGRIDGWGVNCGSFFLWLELHQKQQIFELCKIEKIDLHVLGRL
jgi:hypothetical protein